MPVYDQNKNHFKKILVKHLNTLHENAYLLSLFLTALEKAENPSVFFLLHDVWGLRYLAGL